MTESDSMTTFGALADEWDLEEPPLQLTAEERKQALLSREQGVRKTHFNETQTIRKRGEEFYNAKREAAGEYLKWQQDMRDLYVESGTERGFPYGEKTCTNYVNLHRLYFFHSDIYEQYRTLPLWIQYQVASFYLNDKDPETVPALIALRAKSIKPMLLADGVADSVPSLANCGVPDDYPALQEMCEDGSLSQLRALQIVDECETVGVPQVVFDAVRLWGVSAPECVTTLCNVDKSLLRAIGNNERYSNLFSEAATTHGRVTVRNGDQIDLRELSPREIWDAHIAGRIDGDNGGGGGSKYKGLFDDLINREEALKIARDLDDEELVDEVSAGDEKATFKLTLKRPI